MLERELPLAELRGGMVLTRDIYTSRGILVGERGVVGKSELDSLKIHGLSLPFNKVAPCGEIWRQSAGSRFLTSSGSH